MAAGRNARDRRRGMHIKRSDKGTACVCIHVHGRKIVRMCVRVRTQVSEKIKLPMRERGTRDVYI